MSKKNKRQVSKSKPTAQSTDFTRVAPPSTPTPITSRRMGDQDFNPDYSYVVKDLRRIGILAGTFITVLIALSFFLR